jgi:hypothetical protein
VKTVLNANTLPTIKPADILRVYSGRANYCCCGCAGSYRYNPAHRAAARRHARRRIDAKEFNAAQVKRVLGIVQARAASTAADFCAGDHARVTVGTRWYVIYLV